MDSKVVSLVTKAELSSCEEFIKNYMVGLKGSKVQPDKIIIIEYRETEDTSTYDLILGGPGPMRPHNLIGILACLQHEVAAT